MSPTTYDNRRDEAIAWLYGRINYETTSPIPYSLQGMKLDRVRELATRLGDPQDRLRVTHIAGTKGKGSTAAMIATALQSSGRKVGVYSSPHFDRIEERFAINGEPCTASDLVSLVDRVRPQAEAMDAESADGRGPTFFDLTTVMSFLHFADHAVDAAVIEVGLGGRLDSTNIVSPAISVITSISFDHTKQLGDTLAKIAAEKAGIIKPGVPVVSGVTADEPAKVIQRVAEEQGAPLSRLGHEFMIEPEKRAWRFADQERETQIEGLLPALPGDRQAENAAVALAALGRLAPFGLITDNEARITGVQNGRLPGRMERFPGEPFIVIDGAHNDASAAALAQALPELCGVPRDRRVLVVAIAADKDARAVLLPLVDETQTIVATRFVDNPRAIAPVELAKIVEELAPPDVAIDVADDPVVALGLAQRLASPDGAIVFAGSLLFAAEVRRLVVAERGAPPK